MGLLNYIVDDFDPNAREVIFVPVAINYDRVLEDMILIKADQSGTRKFKPSMSAIFYRVLRHILLRISGKFRGFGVASVSFGEPLELSKYHREGDGDLTEAVAHELMQRIADVTPVLGVPLVARHILAAGTITIPDLEAAVGRSVAFLAERHLPCLRRKPSEIVKDAVSRLAARDLIAERSDSVTATEEGAAVLTFYANTIAHHFNAGAIEADGIAAVAE
jgi:glycerol-3-phosphate O-acyltransferase